MLYKKNIDKDFSENGITSNNKTINNPYGLFERKLNYGGSADTVLPLLFTGLTLKDEDNFKYSIFKK